MKKAEAIKTIAPAEVKSGMEVRVHQKIKEVTPKGEEKERIQVFEGLVIERRGGRQPGATFTVRKVSDGVGVEKIFPVHLPSMVKIELVKQFQARRAQLSFMRGRYRKKMKEMPVEKILKHLRTEVAAVTKPAAAVEPVPGELTATVKSVTAQPAEKPAKSVMAASSAEKKEPAPQKKTAEKKEAVPAS